MPREKEKTTLLSMLKLPQSQNWEREKKKAVPDKGKDKELHQEFKSDPRPLFPGHQINCDKHVNES